MSASRATVVMAAVMTAVAAQVVGFMLLVAITGPADAQPTKVIDVFVLSGQSNAVRIPDTALEAELEAVLGADSANHETVVFKNAVSGTSIYLDWQPDGTADTNDDGQILKDLYQAYAVFMADLAGENPDAEIRMAGLFWNQGERDARLEHGEIYYDQLNLMIADFRATMNAPDLPVFISRIKGINSYVDNDLVRAGQDAVGQDDPDAYTIDVDDIEPFDGLHWNATGALRLAERYADVYAQIKLADWPECGTGQVSPGECVRAGDVSVVCDARDGVATVSASTVYSAELTAGLGVVATGDQAADSVPADSAPVSEGGSVTLAVGSLGDGTSRLVIFGDGLPVRVVEVQVECDLAIAGDVDCDSVIDAADVQVVLGGLVGNADASNCETEALRLSNCDLVADQGCALDDAWRLAQCIAAADPDAEVTCDG